MKNKRNIILTVIVAAAILFGVFVMFMGSAGAYIDGGVLKLSITMGGSSSVPLEDITGLEFRDSFAAGSRSFGIGSAKLQGGTFKNGEFGKYKLYSYTKVPCMVVVKTADGVYCFNMETKEETEKIYNELKMRLQD